MKKAISSAVIRRLPKYLRYLTALHEQGEERISSQKLSVITGFTASQIRQDLNHFGGFGQQGYGYNVKELYNNIGNILGLTRDYNTVIIGAGNIGQAIANYNSFNRLGFKLKGIFDANPRMFGIKIRDIEIQDVEKLKDFVRENDIEIGIICVPRTNAQKVCNDLVEGGIKGIWNFAPIDLDVPKDIRVENVHLSESMMTLVYLLNHNDVK